MRHEKVFHIIQLPHPTQCNVPILTPFRPPPSGCGLWLFPHNDRCAVMIIRNHKWFYWSRLRLPDYHTSYQGKWEQIFLLRHEKVFQAPNIPACNSIFYSCQTQQEGRHIVLKQ